MKKILFIESRTGGDFTMDAVWAGLVDRFGQENVVDWPPKAKHREGVPTLTGNVEADYGAERRSLCYTPGGIAAPFLTLQEVTQLLRSGQVEFIFVDERHETYDEYIKTTAYAMDVPVVVVAGHDRFWNTCSREPEKILGLYYRRNLRAIFADNWVDEYRDNPRIFPMSYATNFDHLWDHRRRQEFLQDKVYDLFFMGYSSHPDRAEIVDHLVQKYGHEGNCLFVEKRPNTMDAFLPKAEYFKKMAQSRVCINLRGAAECGKALRFYEIPYVGSYLLSQKFGGEQVHPFIGGLHCDYFENVDQLDELIDTALVLPKRREYIASYGHQHALKFHTARARVDYMFECLDKR